MRICMFAMLVPRHILGGMEIHSLDLAKGLARAGHDVTIITSRHRAGLKSESIGGVGIHYVDSRPWSKWPLGGAALAKFDEIHRVQRFDVVHSQSMSAMRYLGVRWSYRVPMVTTVHGTPRSSIRSNLNQGASLSLAPRICYHWLTELLVFRRLLRESDRIIAISKDLAERVPGEYGIDPAKVRTVYNGVDVGRFKPEAAPPNAEHAGRMILAISVLHRQKGVQNLIAALPRIRDAVPDARLIIVGDGPYRPELERLAASLDARDAVEFAGNVPNEEVAGHYNACDVFCIPSLAVEGLPLTLLEAMSSGKPVVASDIGGIPSVISDGVNGLLFKPKDVDGLAERLVRVLSDRNLAAALGAAARKTIVDGFSVERMVADTIRVYREVEG